MGGGRQITWPSTMEDNKPIMVEAEAAKPTATLDQRLHALQIEYYQNRIKFQYTELHDLAAQLAGSVHKIAALNADLEAMSRAYTSLEKLLHEIAPKSDKA